MNTVLSISLALAAAQVGLGAAIPQTLESRAPGPAIVPIGTGLGAYTSIGCYQDTYDPSRQILTKWQYDPLMTLTKCAAIAKQGNFQYFGVSNGQYCYYDDQIRSYSGLTSGPITDDKCAVPCGGAPSQNCGSFWTNTMFQLTTSMVPAAPWTAVSSPCTAEGVDGRALTGASTSSSGMTSQKCTAFCASKGFAIAGVEYGSECYCGNSLVNGASLSKPSTQCNMACAGEVGQNCGGPGGLKLFVLPTVATALNTDLTAKAATLPTGWAAASTACVAEGTTGRALTGASTQANDMTPGKCATFCAGQGFGLAGVEYGGECYCGTALTNGASLSKVSNSCNMPCTGSASLICGGPGALSLYVNPSIAAPAAALQGSTVSGALPTGWSAASTKCVAEVNGRALTGFSTSAANMTIATCLSTCQQKGFQYAGLEFGSECYCGNGPSNGASFTAAASTCTMPCSGDSTSTCGGANGIQLFTNPSLGVAPAPTLVGGYTAAGCIQEVAGRALTGLRVDNANMTQETCVATCAAAGFKFAGIEYGAECYCGNALANNATLTLTSGQCVMACPGNSSQKCGGPNAIQLFSA